MLFISEPLARPVEVKPDDVALQALCSVSLEGTQRALHDRVPWINIFMSNNGVFVCQVFGEDRYRFAGKGAGTRKDTLEKVAWILVLQSDVSTL